LSLNACKRGRAKEEQPVTEPPSTGAIHKPEGRHAPPGRPEKIPPARRPQRQFVLVGLGGAGEGQIKEKSPDEQGGVMVVKHRPPQKRRCTLVTHAGTDGARSEAPAGLSASAADTRPPEL
jgi:hypothetical protein